MLARRLCCIIVHILCLVGVSARHFLAPTNLQGTIQNQHSMKMTAFSNQKGGIMGSVEKEEKYKKIGSKPPRCDNKCYGCMPCEAIQVPTTTSHGNGHVGILYTNYEPEGWKCKCGPTFFTP